MVTGGSITLSESPSAAVPIGMGYLKNVLPYGEFRHMSPGHPNVVVGEIEGGGIRISSDLRELEFEIPFRKWSGNRLDVPVDKRCNRFLVFLIVNVAHNR